MTGKSRTLALSESSRSVPSCLPFHLHGFDTSFSFPARPAHTWHIYRRQEDTCTNIIMDMILNKDLVSSSVKFSAR